MNAPFWEKPISALGGFLAVLLVWEASREVAGDSGAPLIMASAGASAVLLFAVPHGLLSQPWPLLGGHVISAFIGVTCFVLLGDNIWAGAAAVGLSIGAMYYLRCLHPPGGATALTAVIGGPAIHSLGYAYLLVPVLLNALLVLAVAVLFNYLFSWRRYPLRWLPAPPKSAPAGIDRADLHYALEHFGAFLDVAESDLESLFALARNHAQSDRPAPQALRPGHYYSNGLYGESWEIREIVGLPDAADAALLTYRVTVGRQRRALQQCSREEFAAWAKYEVCRDENTWRKLTSQELQPC